VRASAGGADDAVRSPAHRALRRALRSLEITVEVLIERQLP
jgi:hypothetical protein